MKKARKFILGLVIVGVSLSFSYQAFAEYYNIGDKEVAFEGFVRQEVSVNLNDSSPTNEGGVQSAYHVWLFDTSVELTRSFEFRGIFRLWADLVYWYKDERSHFDKFFGDSDSEYEFFGDTNDIFREFYVTYNHTKFMIRAGRQQVGWGESDGLRLMDVVNPLDMRHSPFYDTQGYEEMRIPKWLLKTEVYPGHVGPITDIALQLIWNPGDIQERLQLQLPNFVDAQNQGTATPPIALPNSGGVWAVPTPSGYGLPFVFDYNKRDTELRNSEFGARLAFNYKQTFMTLNFWHGFAPESLVKFTGIGPDFRAPAAPPPFPPAPLVVNFDLIWPRVTYAGFTLNKELGFVGSSMGLPSNPVLRFESLFSFDQDFNTLEVVPTTIGGVPIPGAPPADIAKIVTKDQLRYMVGFDWAVPFRLLNPRKNFFLSGQMFHFHTFDYDDDKDWYTGDDWLVPDSSPYQTWTVPEDQFYGSMLVRTEYLNERVVPSILYVRDFHTQADWCVTDIGFKVGDHWRPRLRWLYIDGPTQESFGVYKDRDEISLRIEYQF